MYKTLKRIFLQICKLFRNCSTFHSFGNLRTGLNPSLIVILSAAKNLSITQDKLREESPLLETLHFIQSLS